MKNYENYHKMTNSYKNILLNIIISSKKVSNKTNVSIHLLKKMYNIF